MAVSYTGDVQTDRKVGWESKRQQKAPERSTHFPGLKILFCALLAYDHLSDRRALCLIRKTHQVSS